MKILAIPFILILLSMPGLIYAESEYSDANYPAPLKQVKTGVLPSDIKCNDSMVKIYKFDDTPICVKYDTAKKLIDREFAWDLIEYPEKNIPDAKCRLTESNPEGPYYTPDAPFKEHLGLDLPGNRIVITGFVMNQYCEKIPNAVIDLWHTDNEGNYDNDGFTFRGKVLADDTGKYTINTIIPKEYSEEGTIRPSHIHLKIHDNTHELLTTQLYFDGDPYFDILTKKSLILNLDQNDITRSNYDFVVYQKDAKQNDILQTEIIEKNIDIDNVESEKIKSDLVIINYVVYDDVLPDYVLDIAFKKWSDVNPNFLFVNHNQTDSLKIKPVSTHYDSYFEDRNSLLMGFYDSDTNTIYISKDENPTVSINTLTHEFGHYLGLAHSCQKNSPYNIMYSQLDRECVEDESYDTLGYNLPTNTHRLFVD